MDNHKITSVNLADLLFDIQNPRLAANFDDGAIVGNNESIIQLLDEEADLSELTTSIFENGYLDFEPLIVLENNNKYIVLEGNRRLAALTLMQDAKLRKKVGITLSQEKIDAKKRVPEKLNVIIVDNREDAQPLIGFKHIRGAFKWTSYAKAKYLTNIYREKYNDPAFINSDIISSITKQIGDTNNTVRNLIGGMLVLEQAENEGLFKVTDRTKPGPLGLSHLYTALNNNDYQEYLSLDRGWNKQPSLEPISSEMYDKFEEVLKFLYGSKSGNFISLIKSQNPDVKKLGEVLLCDEGLKDLQSGSPLDTAYEHLIEDDIIFDIAIRKALEIMNLALAKVSKYNGLDESIVEISKKIFKSARTLNQAVETEYNDQNEQ